MAAGSGRLNRQIIRIKTGIDGLDEALGGGVPSGDIVLITGTPGSGKTTLAAQVLVYGARNGELGLYFTLEESAEDIIQQSEVFYPDFRDLINSGNLKIVEVPLTDYESFKQTIISEIEATGAKRITIDSITYFQMFFSDTMSIRKAVIEVSTILKQKNCLGLFIGEIAYGENKLSTFGVEEFATDGVIELSIKEKGGLFIRAVRVVKMRNTKHLTKLCPMDITDKGIVVYPNAELFADT
jgi:KaiC/GvpD/RAD55 family RecA-like ATPase